MQKFIRSANMANTWSRDNWINVIITLVAASFIISVTMNMNKKDTIIINSRKIDYFWV